MAFGVEIFSTASNKNYQVAILLLFSDSADMGLDWKQMVEFISLIEFIKNDMLPSIPDHTVASDEDYSKMNSFRIFL